MKRFFISILFFLCTSFCFAAEPLKQYQTFSWKAIANARGYSLSIQQKTTEKDETGNIIYNDIAQEELAQEQTKYEILLYPGEYRVMIATINVLGKKQKASWLPFIILNETEPFLYNTTFTFDKARKSPVFLISKDESDAKKENEVVKIDIKGKNIFFKETAFSFEPLANTKKDASQFERFSSLAATIPCKVISRDREKSIVTITADKKLFSSGYYNLIVKNPKSDDEEKATEASLELFVSTDKAPTFFEKGLEYDRHYGFRNVNIEVCKQGEDDEAENAEESENPETTKKSKSKQKEENLTFDFLTAIPGFNFTSDTKISFDPIIDSIYPFESSKEKTFLSAIPVKNIGNAELNKDAALIQFKMEQQNPVSGSYLMTAQNQFGQTEKVKVLLNVNYPDAEATTIEKISSTFNRNTKAVDITLQGTNLAENFSYLTVSHLLENGTNARVPLSVTSHKRNKTEVVLRLNSEDLPTVGLYGLLIETDTNPVFVYFDISSNYRTTLKKLSVTEVANRFFKPADFTIDDTGEKWIVDYPVNKEKIFINLSKKEDWYTGQQWRLLHLGNKDYFFNSADWPVDIMNYSISEKDENQMNKLINEHYSIETNTVATTNEELIEKTSVRVKSISKGDTRSWVDACITFGQDADIFSKGDTLLIKIDSKKATSLWSFYLTTKTGEEFLFSPKKPVKLRKGITTVEIPYNAEKFEKSFRCTKYDKLKYKSPKEIPLPAANDLKCVWLYRGVKNTDPGSEIKILDIKIYDIAKSDLFRPETLVKPHAFTDLGFAVGLSNYALKAMQNGTNNNKATLIGVGMDLNLIRFTDWLAVNVALKEDLYLQTWDASASLRLEVPIKYFSPYAGIGYGGGQFGGVVPMYAGVVLFNFLDFKYECQAIMTGGGTMFYDYYSVGLHFKLRKNKIVKEPLI